MTEVRALDLDAITIAGRKLRADVADAVIEVGLAHDVGTVGELTLTLIDPDRRLARSEIVTLGSILQVGGTRWQVGAVDRTYASHGALVTVRARSQLAKRLRSSKKTGAVKGRTVRQWLSKLAKEAGGTAVVQSGPTQKQISISNDQSLLDAIGSVTSAANMAWTEHDGVIYAGTPWWALQGGPQLPTWPLTWMLSPKSDVLELSSALTDDDKEQTGTATFAVPQSFGAQLRPWHRIDLAGTGGSDDGMWLVTGVEATLDATSPVTVQAHRPKRSKPKAGGTAERSADQGLDLGGLGTASGKGAIAVRAALAQVGEPYTYTAHPPDTWDCSKLTAWAWGQAGVSLYPLTYTQVDQCAKFTDRNQLQPGDLIFYFRDAHHVAMWIGDGTGRKVHAANPERDVCVDATFDSWFAAHFSTFGRPMGA